MLVSKVPVSVKRKMHKLAMLSKQMAKLNREISEFFISKGLNEDALRCGDGMTLDELLYGNDVTDELCKDIEEGKYDNAASPFLCSK